MLRFQLGKIPVAVRGSFLFLPLILGMRELDNPARLATWLVIVFFSVLIHELGHALAFLRYGHQPSIELYALGGLTRGTAGVKSTAPRDLIIALAGPIFGFITGGIVWTISRGMTLSPFGDRLVSDILWVNIGWGILNLLPMQPLDGGHALSGAMRSVAPIRGERIALAISLAVAVVVAVLAAYLHQIWIALIAVFAAVSSYQRLRQALARGDDGSFDPLLTEAFGFLRDDKTPEVRATAEQILAQATNPLVRRDATQLIAWSYLAEGEPQSALTALERMPQGQSPDPALLGSALLRIDGREREAIGPLTKAFAAQPTAAIAAELAIALARAEDYAAAHALVMGPNGTKLDDRSHGEIERTLFYAGRYSEAFDVSKIRFDRYKSPQASYNAACAKARLGQHDEAMTHLQKAFAAGFSDRALLAKDEDLVELRSRPEFQALLGARSS